jgi:Rod binding domain-containing protein
MVPLAPDPAELATPQAARAWRTAQDFEAMALAQLLSPMLDTVDLSAGPFGGGAGEQAFKPFLTEAIAKRMASHGGLGLAVPVFHQMLRIQEAAESAT